MQRAKWLKQYGLTPADARRLERALCTLADFEGTVKRALADSGARNGDWAHVNVCKALRHVVDGHENH